VTLAVSALKYLKHELISDFKCHVNAFISSLEGFYFVLEI
jgi:hypothetical protein